MKRWTVEEAAPEARELPTAAGSTSVAGNWGMVVRGAQKISQSHKRHTAAGSEGLTSSPVHVELGGIGGTKGTVRIHESEGGGHTC